MAGDLPDALVVGPMKAGTTWIYDYLRARGDVELPVGVKETFFFDRHWIRGTEWYRRHFANTRKSCARTVEVAPRYFHDPKVPQRVRSTLGDIPLLVTLRDPVRRAWSHYLHLRRYGYTADPLKKAVEAFPEIIEASEYSTCISRWAAEFSQENITVVWQEDLAISRENYAYQLCIGLGLEYQIVPESLHKRSNEGAIPKSRLLAAVGRKGARALRDIGLYRPVEWAKNIGVKPVFFGAPGSAKTITPTEDEVQWLEKRLRTEYNETNSIARTVR